MKLLRILGNDHPTNKEIEVFADNQFGLDILIKYVDGRSEVRHNCTEFHHRYNEDRFKEFPKWIASAFESDLHGTGGTVEVRRMEEIVVKEATKQHESY